MNVESKPIATSGWLNTDIHMHEGGKQTTDAQYKRLRSDKVGKSYKFRDYCVYVLVKLIKLIC